MNYKYKLIKVLNFYIILHVFFLILSNIVNSFIKV